MRMVLNRRQAANLRLMLKDILRDTYLWRNRKQVGDQIVDIEKVNGDINNIHINVDAGELD